MPGFSLHQDGWEWTRATQEAVVLKRLIISGKVRALRATGKAENWLNIQNAVQEDFYIA